MSSAVESLLRSGISQLRLSLDDAQITRLVDFQSLIAKWTQVYNLTAVRDPLEMVTHHLLDSLAIVGPLNTHLEANRLGRGARVLDVGSGAGLPGVVIAICRPDVAVSCIDTVAKKAAFIKQAALALSLPNLTSIHGRVEELRPAESERFNVICSRAFSSLQDFTSWSSGAIAAEGTWLAMKGKYPADELDGLPPEVKMFHVEQLQVPGMQGDRCIVWMRQSTAKSD